PTRTSRGGTSNGRRIRASARPGDLRAFQASHLVPCRLSARQLRSCAALAFPVLIPPTLRRTLAMRVSERQAPPTPRRRPHRLPAVGLSARNGPPDLRLRGRYRMFLGSFTRVFGRAL